MKIRIHVKDEDKPKRRSGFIVAMLHRHPHTQIHRDRRKRRVKDARNHWLKEWNDG